MEREFSIWTTFSDVPLLPEIFRWNNQKSHVSFTFQPDFPETFVNGKQPLHISAQVPTQLKRTEELKIILR